MNDTINLRTVLSTRPSVPGEEEIALKHNIRLISCPSSSYRWMTPPQYVLNEIMKSSVDAWVFTSRRGVEGWKRVWDSLENNRPDPGIPTVYAIGDGTTKALRDLFQLMNVRQTLQGDGKALARFAVSEGVQHAVHFCGTARRPELRNVFRENKVQLTEAEVYRRTEIMKPDPKVISICESGEMDAILFFSPDGVKGFRRLYGLPKGDWIPVAIGTTTADSVRTETGRLPLIAGSPSFTDMIRLV